ncbi:MAG: hypothetical protein H6730_08430 [Deltaproteobacteria bacterium]|nr:hypothetical protein [Deltaproteobacteria bacterium]
MQELLLDVAVQAHQHQGAGPEADAITREDGLRFDRHPVDPGAVVAAEVADLEAPALGAADLGVASRDVLGVELQVAVDPAPEQRAGADGDVAAYAVTGEDHEVWLDRPGHLHRLERRGPVCPALVPVLQLAPPQASNSTPRRLHQQRAIDLQE